MSGGLQKQVLTMGYGQSPQRGQQVTVHYVGQFLNGTVFDSSVNRNQPFSFVLGAGQVIPGWDIGVATMKVGETSIFIIPPELAYGARGAPPTIPPNSTLQFTVTLLQ